MKKISVVMPYILLFSGIMWMNNMNAQCLNQVSHVSGTEIVNGINVTVTSGGSVDTFYTYCPEVTKPYFIGYDWTTETSNDGAYSFQFDPLVDSLTLNFSGISNNSNGHEIIKLEVNGSHYPIPQIGNYNNCDPLAVLTANGNISGCFDCGVSGWAGTTLTGPIKSLTVKDSVGAGITGGSLFSIFICNESLVNIYENENINLNIYPNPVRETLTIEGKNINNAKIYMVDLYGRNINIVPYVQYDKALVYLSKLPKGIYFLRISRNEKMVIQKIIIM
jgi:type IX secretion system substrate protein